MFIDYLLCATLTFFPILSQKLCKIFTVFQKSQVTYPAENVFKSTPKAHYSWPPILSSFDPWVLNKNHWTSWGQVLIYMPIYIFPPERSMVLNRFLLLWVLEKVNNNFKQSNFM